MKKIKYILTSLLISAFSIIPIAAEETGTGATTPSFQGEEAKTFVSGFLTPAIDVGLWAVPLVAIVAIIVSGIAWLTKEEDEKENKPFTKTLRNIVIVAVLTFSAEVLLRMFGIA